MCRIKSASEDVKNAYRMFLRAEKRSFLSLLKNLIKPTYTSCELGRRYIEMRQRIDKCKKNSYLICP